MHILVSSNEGLNHVDLTVKLSLEKLTNVMKFTKPHVLKAPHNVPTF